MILTLEVLGEQAAELGAGRRKVFDSVGGTIGRLPDNDWVFADPYISGRHALIRYVGGRFFVEDTSTNGVFLNSPQARLPKAQAQPLAHGDVLYIDAYRIAVCIEPDNTEECTANLGRRPAAVADEHATEWFGLSEMLTPPQASAQRRSIRPEPLRSAARRRAAGSEPVRSAVPVRSVQSGPDVRDIAGADSTSAGEGAQLRELLAAAGIEGVEPSSDLARTCGAVLRVVVDGMMEMLRSRERMRQELRVRSTVFKAADNNPLKFSANAGDAFHNLLVKRNPAYLAPPEAFEEAMHDLRDHQAAVLGALRLAFETLLAQFDPQRLQQEFERQKKGSILGLPGRPRHWELYCEKYGEWLQDADATYRNLFGEAFAKAYEEQLERLKARGRER